jgi:hypothetical protein
MVASGVVKAASNRTLEIDGNGSEVSAWNFHWSDPVANSAKADDWSCLANVKGL